VGTNVGGTQCIVEAEPALFFSVSKNSGRITVHYGKTGESSRTNFEVEQIMSKETADHMTEARLTRKHGITTTVPLEFDDLSLRHVVKNLDSKKLAVNINTSQLIQEIKVFVTNYLGLREVEKKLLQESGQAYPARTNLKQIVLRNTQANTTTSKVRYTGGAKERARERVENGTANELDKKVLEGVLCAYCGGELSTASRSPGVISTYCSVECATDGRLKRGGMYSSTRVREQVFALEGGVCSLCGIDAYALYTRIKALEPAERLNALMSANWKLPVAAKALERLLQNPTEGDFWNADHITPVSEGGGGCNLDNLRTLCVPCHSCETEKLRNRLKLAGDSKKNVVHDTSKRQLDIRSLFGSAKKG